MVVGGLGEGGSGGGGLFAIDGGVNRDGIPWSRLEPHLSRSEMRFGLVLCFDLPFSLLSHGRLALNQSQSSDMIGHDLHATTDCIHAADCQCLK